MKRKNFRVEGQSLIEVVVALGVVLLVVIALVQAVTTSIKSADRAKKTAQAASYCQEGMENIRAYRDAGWTTFSSRVGPNVGDTSINYDLPGSIPAATACPSTPNLVNTFTRCVKFERSATEKVKIILTVSWADSSGTHKSDLISYFTKWQ